MITRRETLRNVAVLAAANVLEKTTDGGYAEVSLPGSPKRPSPVLPPNAVGDFRIKCVGCGICVKACPTRVLRQSTSLARFGQPEMDFRRDYCRLACKGACAEVCPAGALLPLGTLKRKDIHMGHAIWKKDLCVRTTKGDKCNACARKCPVKAIEIIDGIPVIDKAKCVGCGACEHVCPARPMPAIFVKGFERQRIVRPVASYDLISEMANLIDGGASAAVAKNGVITAVRTGRGLAPLMELYREGLLKGAVVMDKVIGRAAAAICIDGGALEVYARLMSADAAEMLSSRGIKNSAEKTVAAILNRERAGSCPMEAAVKSLNEPAEMVDKLRKVMNK
jgi:ferredoxin